MNVLSGSFTPLLVFLTPKYRSAEVGSDASIESILIGMVDFGVFGFRSIFMMFRFNRLFLANILVLCYCFIVFLWLRS